YRRKEAIRSVGVANRHAAGSEQWQLRRRGRLISAPVPGREVERVPAVELVRVREVVVVEKFRFDRLHGNTLESVLVLPQELFRVAHACHLETWNAALCRPRCS